MTCSDWNYQLSSECAFDPYEERQVNHNSEKNLGLLVSTLAGTEEPYVYLIVSFKIEEPRTKRELVTKSWKLSYCQFPQQGSNFDHLYKFHSKQMFKACVRDTWRHSMSV